MPPFHAPSQSLQALDNVRNWQCNLRYVERVEKRGLFVTAGENMDLLKYVGQEVSFLVTDLSDFHTLFL